MSEKNKSIIAHEGEVYRAKVKSWGFRDRYWDPDDNDNTFTAVEGEKIPKHFELIQHANGEKPGDNGEGGSLKAENSFFEGSDAEESSTIRRSKKKI